MENLFTEIENEAKLKNAPLAVRMRPRTLEDIVGQQAAVGEGSWLRVAIERDALSSVILYGPAGTGKTSLAHVIAETTRATFVEVSAVGGTVADLRREIDAAEKRLMLSGARTILFVDEIHRFNRSQQDALLHAVEDRVVVLVGATTENPYFEVNSALISRSRIVELSSLSDADVELLLDRALSSDRGFAGCYTLDPEARAAIVRIAGGDGRSSLNTLELAAQLVDAGTKEAPALITAEAVELASPRVGRPYDKNKDMHYDVISAFIKSMRGSDPDAALYWLARMIEGGEDPKFIARRMLIAASEDVGNADPQALLVAEAAFRRRRSLAIPNAVSTSRRLPSISHLRRRAMLPRRASTLRSPRFARGLRAKCPTTCATGIVRALNPMVPTNIRTTTRAVGWSSATCPKAWSAVASIVRANAAGRHIASRRRHATAVGADLPLLHPVQGRRMRPCSFPAGAVW